MWCAGLQFNGKWGRFILQQNEQKDWLLFACVLRKFMFVTFTTHCDSILNVEMNIFRMPKVQRVQELISQEQVVGRLE